MLQDLRFRFRVYGLRCEGILGAQMTHVPMVITLNPKPLPLYSCIRLYGNRLRNVCELLGPRV